jgi:hypothetical protein
MFSFRKRERIAADVAIEMYPRRAPGVEWKREGEEIRLTVRRAPTALARTLALFFVIPEKKELSLERFGAMVWEMADGTVTVGRIADRLAEEAGWPKDEACKSVLIYLSMLSSKMLMSVEKEPKAAPVEGAAAAPPAGGPA